MLPLFPLTLFVIFSFQSHQCNCFSLRPSRRIHSFRIASLENDNKESAIPLSPLKAREIFPLSLLSGLGTAEMAYLTYNKLQDLPNFCASQSSESCNSVLNGPFSLLPFTNIPLTLIALFAYASIFILSTFDASDLVQNEWKESFVLMLTSSMATFSLYLMAVLQGFLHASCPYCYLSAFLSVSMAVFTWLKRLVPNRTKAFVLSSISCFVTALGSGCMFYLTSTFFFSPETAMASTAPAAQYLAMEAEKGLPKAPPKITTVSSPRAMALSARLEKLGGNFYGAYWCSHCFNQKQELGKEAFAKVEYIECDKEGVNSQKNLCRAKKIPGYPTWELNGQLFPGEKTIEELEKVVSDVENSASKP